MRCRLPAPGIRQSGAARCASDGSRCGICSSATAGWSRAAGCTGEFARSGLGILAAARALELDFLPLFDEQYQLVIPREFYESPHLTPLLEIVRGPDFRAEVDALGGYDVSSMGRVVWES